MHPQAFSAMATNDDKEEFWAATKDNSLSQDYLSVMADLSAIACSEIGAGGKISLAAYMFKRLYWVRSRA